MSGIECDDRLLISRDNGVTTLTLNKPERLNALDLPMRRRLREMLWRINEDEETNVLVLTGAGRGFCAGGDTKAMAHEHRPGALPKRVYTEGCHLIQTLLAVEKPIIAMVNGPAAGLGATIALFCDVVVMADEASIGDPHVDVGLAAGDGGAVVWPLLVGPLRAKEYLLTGRMLSGVEAAMIGLVNASVPLADLRRRVDGLASEIASRPPYAVRSTKAAINCSVRFMANLVLDSSLAWERISAMSEDHQEALRSRAEGRPARYTGR